MNLYIILWIVLAYMSGVLVTYLWTRICVEKPFPIQRLLFLMFVGPFATPVVVLVAIGIKFADWVGKEWNDE